MSPPNDPKPNSLVEQQMRNDWEGRAREDASYYVAFGRRNQDSEEFFASGAEALTAI